MGHLTKKKYGLLGGIMQIITLVVEKKCALK